MIAVYYESSAELAHAIDSVFRRCQALGTRLLFCGSQVAWREATGALHELDASRALVLRRPADLDEGQADVEGLINETLRSAAILQVLTGGPDVAWVESPQRNLRQRWPNPTHGMPTTVLCAFRSADLSPGSPASLLSCCSAVLRASMLVPCCPSWLIKEGDGEQHGTFPLRPLVEETDLHFSTFEQAERLAVLGQLAAGLAHELGNPLAIIDSSLQYLNERMTAASDPASEFTMTALANVDRMRALLRHMLDCSVRSSPSFKLCDLDALVSEVLRFVHAECRLCEVSVEATLDPAVAWAEARGIQQVVLNVVKNGLEAMVGRSNNKLQVRTRMPEGEGTATVEIENNGPAIPPEDLDRIFKPFHTTKDAGTGLGLYLSRQIAKDHRGVLEVANMDEGGVRFTLTLPLCRPEEAGSGARPDR